MASHALLGRLSSNYDATLENSLKEDIICDASMSMSMYVVRILSRASNSLVTYNHELTSTLRSPWIHICLC